VYRRPSRTPSLLVGGLAVVVALLLGIWLGGHPGNLPQPLRKTLVGGDDVQLMREGLDTIDQIYYRKVDRATLVDKGLAGAVASLHD